jgi:hypothetical protein
VRVTNSTRASVEGDVKASSSDRYSITPSSFRLRPGESAELTVSLRLDPKFAQRRKAIDSGQRDAILIKVSRIPRSWKGTVNLCNTQWPASHALAADQSRLQWKGVADMHTHVLSTPAHPAVSEAAAA